MKFPDPKNTASRRRKLYGLLGDLPDQKRPVSARLISTTEHEWYILENLVLDLNGIEEVPALFVKSKSVDGRRPTVIYNHAHGGDYILGKNELIQGRPALQSPPYAEALAREGWNGLCIDHWCFGERRGKAESETFKEMLWNGQVLWGMMVYDSLRAVDYLAMRTDVDMRRLGTTGISMGSTMAWWLAALDTRIKICVDLCCLTDFHALIEQRGLDLHGIYYYVPGLLKHFSTADINALIAPRPHLSLAGIYDQLTPPDGLAVVDAALKEVYAKAGVPENWRLITCRSGHMETTAMRREVFDFFRTGF